MPDRRKRRAMRAVTLGVKHAARAPPVQLEGLAPRRDHVVRYAQWTDDVFVDEKERGVI
ncbi:hypothetical protein [Burkholderia cenocepacia]|uniref:hypothetical protein n=1 Tax=Burkholderia cenocepacia TaxID=95486 RepID=UPI00158C0403|nr:hypothetical protein [Burkholderia cenocepacia]